MHPHDKKYFLDFASSARAESRSLSDHYLQIQIDTSGASLSKTSDYLHGFEMIREFLDPSLHYLALGCGAGVEIAWLKKNGCHNITGLDISEKLLNHCEETFDIKTVKADMRNTRLDSKSFDVVISCRSLHHMFYPYETLEEMSRLASEMVWVVSEPVKSLIKEIPRKILKKRIISGANIYEYQFDPEDIRRYMAFNGMETAFFERYWESGPQRSKECRLLNRICQPLGNRFAAVFRQMKP